MAFTQQFLFDKSGKPFINITGSFGMDTAPYDGNSLSLDSNDRIYKVANFREDASPPFLPNNGWLGQYSELGNLNWQRSIGASNAQTYADPNELMYDTALSPDEEYVYTTGYTTATYAKAVIFKYDKSGNLQWRKEWGDTSNKQENWACETDSSGNLYIVGGHHYIGTSNYHAYIVKLNSSGVIQWQKLLGTEIALFRDIAIDSSNNIYVGGSGGSPGDIYVAKYNTSGTLIWQKNISRGSNYYEACNAIAVDTSGDVYIAGFSNDGNSSSDHPYVLKLNSSGAFQWSRYFGNYNTDESRVESVTTDRFNNVYIVGMDKTNNSNRDVLIAKMNSSGTVQWKRSFGINGENLAGYSIKTDSKDNIVVGGDIYITGSGGYGVRDYFLARLLSDGTKTGTYNLNGGSWVYQSTTLSDGSLTGWTVTNAGNSESNLSYSISNSSLSDASYTHSSATIVI